MAELTDIAKVELWYFAWEGIPDAGLVEALYPSLSSEEQTQYHRFHFDRDRHAYLFAHVLVRRVLSRSHGVPETAWSFRPGSHGKPFIFSPESHLSFSLTHTAGLVACATSSNPEIGADAERIDRSCNYLDLARIVFTPAETDFLKSAPSSLLPERFFTLWTLKEAYVKARGLGLSLPLQDFEVRPTGGQTGIAFFRGVDENPLTWRLRLFRPTAAHIVAAAVRTAESPEFLLHDAGALLHSAAL